MSLKKTYFASDFHLGSPTYEKSRHREALVVNWLNDVAKDAEAIYLVGDLFDFWFVLMSGLKRFKPSYQITRQRAAFWIVVLLVLKEAQEYVLHWGKWLDNYRATDVVVDWWYVVYGLF